MSPRNHRESEDDDSVQQQQQQQQQQRRGKKSKLMNESGQTDVYRRSLRQEQRTLQKTMLEKTEEMENPEEEAFGQMRSQNNKLWDKVSYTREAVLDGENFDLISARAARQVDRLVQVPRYDPLRLTQKLVSKCTGKIGSSTFFDWSTFGREAGACFNAVPSHVTFLSGTLRTDYIPKERKQRAPKEKETESDEEEEKPEDVKTQIKDADNLSAVERNMGVLNKTLRKRCKAATAANKHKLESAEFETVEDEKRATKRFKRHGSDICAIQYLFNPKSFTQTVENIFHYSFNVKKGCARIDVLSETSNVDGDSNDPVGPVVRWVEPGSKKLPPARQSVVAFTMHDWRELCKAYNVESGDIPNRAKSKYSTKAPSQLSQSQSHLSQEADE